MKFTIEKSRLVSILTIVSKGMSSRSQLPILSGIYLETTADAIIFQTTDLELSVKHVAHALVEQSGSIVVPGRIFMDIIKQLPEAAITVELKQDKLVINAMESHFEINTLSAADFPGFPQIEADKTIYLPAVRLQDMVKKVSKATSKDESRAIITGIYFKAAGNQLQLVATDSYRLAVATATLEANFDEELDIVVPGTVLDEISKLASPQDSIALGNTENQIIFNFGETTLITRKIEGNYPNYEKIIPTQKELTATVDTTALLEAVRRVSVLTQSHTPVVFRFDSDSQTIEVSASTQDVGQASELIAAQIDGQGFEIGFNHQYILNGLQAVDSEELIFEAQNAGKPGIIKNIGEDQYLYLTMPMHLDNN